MADFKYLLDTSTCIELLYGNQQVRSKCVANSGLCCVSEITAIELFYGAFNAPEKYKKIELLKVRTFLDSYVIIGVNDIAESFSREKIRLEDLGLVIEDFDLLIGITARENHLTVVTHNAKHFERIENLNVEDWTLIE